MKEDVTHLKTPELVGLVRYIYETNPQWEDITKQIQSLKMTEVQEIYTKAMISDYYERETGEGWSV